MAKSIAESLAVALIAKRNCVSSGNDEWLAKWSAHIDRLVKNHLPSGSGIDCGTTFDEDRSNDRVLRFTCSFHHMNENGYYDGWTEHKITARATFCYGIDIHVSGPNRNDIHDYLAETYAQALSAPAPFGVGTAS